MKEEIKKILQMVKEKKITAEEAENLMDALDLSDSETAQGYGNTQLVSGEAQASGQNGKFLRVRVTEDGQQKVQVNVPIQLVEIGLKIGLQAGPHFNSHLQELKNIDFAELMEAIKQGASGKLVEVIDGNDLVEVYVD